MAELTVINWFVFGFAAGVAGFVTLTALESVATWIVHQKAPPGGEGEWQVTDAKGQPMEWVECPECEQDLIDMDYCPDCGSATVEIDGNQ